MIEERRQTTSQTQKGPKHEQRRPKPRLPYACNRAYGQNRQTYNEPPGKTPQAVEEAVAEAVAEAAEVVAAVETPPQQEDHPQATPEGELTDFSDNPRTCSREIERRRKSSSHNGNSTTT